MERLELTVSKEQVVQFLQSDFESYMENSQSAGSTNGVNNYACHAIKALTTAGSNKRFMPEEIKSHFQNVILAGNGINNTIMGIIGSGYFGEDPYCDHYKHLIQIADLYNEGRGLKEIGNERDRKTLSEVLTLLKGQIIVANILFDSKHRDLDFQNRIWGDSLEFMKYIAQLSD